MRVDGVATMDSREMTDLAIQTMEAALNRQSRSTARTESIEALMVLFSSSTLLQILKSQRTLSERSNQISYTVISCLLYLTCQQGFVHGHQQGSFDNTKRVPKTRIVSRPETCNMLVKSCHLVISS